MPDPFADPAFQKFPPAVQAYLRQKYANHPASSGSSGTVMARKPLGAQEQADAAMLQGIQDQLLNLRSNLQKYGKEKWNQNIGTRWADYLGRAKLHTSTSDPERNKLMDQIITTEAQATAALMKSAGTRNYQFATGASGHIPHAAGDYDYNMTAIEQLLDKNGPYKSKLRAMGMPEGPQIPTDTGAGSGVGSMGDDALWQKLKEHGLMP